MPDTARSAFESSTADGLTTLWIDGRFQHLHKDKRGLVWLVTGTLAEFRPGDPLTIRTMTVTAVGVERGIDTQALAVPIGDVLRRLSALVSQRDRDQRTAYAAMTGKTAAWPEQPAPKVQDGRRGRSRERDEHLRRIAAAYLELQDKPGSLYAALAKRFHIAPATVKDRVYAATDAGWLGAATHGKATRQPGPRLTRWQERDKQ